MLPGTQTAPSCTVSELTRDVKVLLESHFDWVNVEGEIGDFTAASSGHWYFTLKDSKAQVRCAMFKRANMRVKVKPGRGDHVRIRARVSLYEARGEFQLICEHLAPAGDGSLQLAFEALKARLAAEGLFAPERKQPLPDDAQHIGVVTSASGAAIHDVLSVLERRSPRAVVRVYPVPVQGEGAGLQIAAAIDRANHFSQTCVHPIDVLIVTRGGGSLEDLWAFNEEVVARAIAASELPVISAVGHEVDFSIADFVADYRAPTPSAAAEVVTTDQLEWQQRLDHRQVRLHRAVQQHLLSAAQRLHHLQRRLRHPGQLLNQRRQTLGDSKRQLNRAIERRLERERASLKQLKLSLSRRHPQHAMAQRREQLSIHQQRLSAAMTRRLHSARDRLQQQTKLLETLGPQNTLARGYAIVTDEAGVAVRDSAQVALGATVDISLAVGRVGATIKDRRD